MRTKQKLLCLLTAWTLLANIGCDQPAGTNAGSKSLTGIAVTTPPTKVQYDLNEEFAPAGMVVTATYSDGSTEAVTGYQTSGFSSDTAGNKTVTVTYHGKTAEFTVTVIDPTKETAATPTASPAAGPVASGTAVALSTSTPDADIWYTTDGSAPAKDGSGSTKYTTPIAVTAALTIKAIAVKDGMNDSAILEAAYTLNQTPVADDFDIGNLSQTATTISAVTVTPKAGKSTGAVTVYYDGSTSLPVAAGEYAVTFDVAAVTGWNAASALAAGTLTVTDVSNAVGIRFSGFGDELINLSLDSGNDIPYMQGVIIAVDGDYDYYEWYVDGYSRGSWWGNTFSISDLSIGIHTVTAAVRKNNVPYSKEATFRIVR